LAVSVTSMISERRIPVLSVALKATGSAPDRVPGVSSPVPDFRAESTGGCASSIVTLEPMSWVCTTSLAPRLHTAVRPDQQPA
jgi:hypothetical protein